MKIKNSKPEQINTHKREKNKIPILSIKEALFKYKGFTIAIVAIIIFLLIIAFVHYDPTVEQEKVSYAQQLHVTAQSDLNTYIQSVIDEQANPQPTTLDETYLSSTKDDLAWLVVKENTLYNSQPTSDLYPKEVAFNLFMQSIVQVNEDYAFDLTNPNYDTEIQKALALSPPQKELLTQDELDSAFTSDNEKQIYTQTLNKLFNDYFQSKISFINSITAKERQFVEAKKLNMLVLDENY